MRISSLNRITFRRNRSKKPQKRTFDDVLRDQLAKAYDLHPGYLMPGSITAALEAEGFTIVSHEDFDREILEAYQMGYTDALDDEHQAQS